MDTQTLKDTIRRALVEDIGDGDITTNSTISAEEILSGRLVSKAQGIIAGLMVVQLTFTMLDEKVTVLPQVADGTQIEVGTLIATVEGPGRAILSGERVALNFLQRMSGIATATHYYVKAIQDTQAIILDTRKTAPGLRAFDKWAIQLGGGQNHRFGLFDEVLIKDNHIAVVGTITETVQRVRAIDDCNRPIVVEVKNLDELREVLPLQVTRILLDNMSPDAMRSAVEITKGHTPLEASGNVTLDTIATVAETGVDYISVGALTHSVKALDINLLLNR